MIFLSLMYYERDRLLSYVLHELHYQLFLARVESPQNV